MKKPKPYRLNRFKNSLEEHEAVFGDTRYKFQHQIFDPDNNGSSRTTVYRLNRYGIWNMVHEIWWNR